MSNEIEDVDMEETPAKEKVDPKILEIKNQLDPVELIKEGYVTVTLEVKPNILLAKYRSLTGEQVKSINQESSRFAAPKYEDIRDGGRRIKEDAPSRQELLDFVMYTTLSHSLLEVNGDSLGKTRLERTKSIQKMDAVVVGAIYKKMHQFFSAVGLLFEDEDDTKQVDTLKN